MIRRGSSTLGSGAAVIRRSTRAISVVAFATALVAALDPAPSQGGSANPRLSLRWKPVDGAAGYELEIARDPHFRQIVVRQRISVAGYRWDELPREPHFWRVRSFDRDNRVGDWSPAQRIEAAVVAPMPASPRSGAVVFLSGAKLDLDLAAHPSPLLREYTFELSRDPSFAQGVQVRRSVDGSARFTLDALGSWHWRVRGTDLSGRDAGASPTQRLELRLGAPEAESPPNAAVLRWSNNAKQVALRWKPQPHANGYVVEVSEGGTARTLSSASPQLDLALSGPRAISWRVAAIDKGGRQTPFSPMRTVTFLVGGASPTTPAAKAVVTVRDPSSPVRFSWTLPEGASGVEIEIARDDTFSGSILRLNAEGSTGEATLPGPGAYVWRVIPRGPRSVTFGPSQATPFEVKLAPPPMATLPVDGPRPPTALQPRRVQLGLRAGWSTAFSALSSPYLGLVLTWEPGWWRDRLAVSARAGLHGGAAALRFADVEGTYSVQTRVVPLTALLSYQARLGGWRLRGGAGAGVHVVRSWIGTRSELTAVPAAAAVVEVSRRLGPGWAQLEVGYALGFTDGDVARGHTGGLLTTFGYEVGL